MGTVTALGGGPYESERFSPAVTTTTGSISTGLFTITPSVHLDDWQTAVDFAVTIAKQKGKVTIRKVDAQWAVSWSEQNYGYQPYTPTYPQPWTYPYGVTYTTGASA